MSRLKPLKRQTIVLTGTSSGIGLATAELAAERGARLAIASRNGEELERIAARLRGRGAEVEAVPTDVSDEGQVQAPGERAIARFGGFDLWVNDAAAAVYGTLEEIPTADHRQVFDVGYWGVVHGSMTAAAQPIETRRTSLLLEAQMRPWLPIVGLCALAGIALAGLGGTRSRR